MLKHLKLDNVGPISDFDLCPGSGLNVFTGDNGLGKSFILDVIWFALTRCWPASVNRKLTSGYMAKPFQAGKPATISFEMNTDSNKDISRTLKFDANLQQWKLKVSRPPIPGIVIYAHIDGSFSVWDPHKNYWRQSKETFGGDDMPKAFVFSPQEVWYGLNNEDESIRYCNGLLQDLYDWQRDDDWKIHAFNTILKHLSPPDVDLTLGAPIKLSINDARKVPTVHMPYGDTSILVAAAGIKRMFALAYFLTWTLLEHQENSRLLGKKPTSQITFLMDEIEAHLHPKWQRKIVTCLTEAFQNDDITTFLGTKPKMQVFLATHSPLVMTSLEGHFNKRTDKWFDINAEGKTVTITQETFVPHGNSDAWLTGSAFDLSSARSPNAELGIQLYNQAVAEHSKLLKQKALDILKKALPDTDEFWRIYDFIHSEENLT